MIGVQHVGLDGLEYRCPGVDRDVLLGRRQGRRQPGGLAVHLGVRGQGNAIAGGGFAAQQDSRRAAVVDGVVDEPGVAAQGDAAAGGVQVGLGGDGVLPVGQPVTFVGQHLDQHHAQVRGAAFAPIRCEQTHSIQQHPPQARVILGQIIDFGCGKGVRWAVAEVLAVQFGVAVDFEGELDIGQNRIEGRGLCVDVQGVAGVVTGAVGAHQQHVVGGVQPGHQCWILAGGERVGGRHPLHTDTRDALPAGDCDVLGLDSGGRFEQPHQQGALRGPDPGDLEVVDAVERAGEFDHLQAALLAAHVGHVGAPLAVNWSVRRCWVRLTV